MSSILKVDTIQNTGGTTALTMDSSGRVTKPQHPSFMVNYNVTWASIAANAVVPFDTDSGGALFNNGNHFNTSTNAFVAPVAGVYSFSINIYTGQNDTTNVFGPFLNGSAVQLVGAGLYGQHGEDAAFDETISITFLLNLALNDSVKIHAVATSDIYGRASTFCGHLIG
jgi:hypothetical protein